MKLRRVEMLRRAKTIQFAISYGLSVVTFSNHGVGRGRGAGRGLGVGLGLAVGVAVGVGVGVPPGRAKAYTLLSPAM